MRLIAIALFAALLLAPGGVQDKVTLCHKGQTITIGAPAVRAHVANHGDTLGACSDSEPDAEAPPATPTTTTTVPIEEDDPPVGLSDDGQPDLRTTVEPPPHSHDTMVLRCTVIDE